MCRALGIFKTTIYCFLSGFYLMPERNRAGTFILISHARETQAQAMEGQAQGSEAHSKARSWLDKLTTWGVVQITPRPPSHPEGFCFGWIPGYLSSNDGNILKVYENHKRRKNPVPVSLWLVSLQTPRPNSFSKCCGNAVLRSDVSACSSWTTYITRTTLKIPPH